MRKRLVYLLYLLGFALAVFRGTANADSTAATEEGQVMTREELLAQLRPLPAGLTGGIAVKELTVQESPSFAVVPYLADERESVFLAVYPAAQAGPASI